MSLIEKNDPVNKIEIVGPFKIVRLRSAKWVEKDGKQIGEPEYTRHTFFPGQSSDIPEVQAVIDAVHTDSVITAYQSATQEDV